MNEAELMREINRLWKEIQNFRTQESDLVGSVSYTVSWTSTGTQPSIGNGTLLGRYTLHGRAVHLNIQMTAGSSTSFGSGNWRFTAPLLSANNNMKFFGLAYARKVNVSSHTFFCQLEPGSNDLYYFHTTSPTGSNVINLTPTVPFTWAANDILFLDLWYERG